MAMESITPSVKEGGSEGYRCQSRALDVHELHAERGALDTSPKRPLPPEFADAPTLHDDSAERGERNGRNFGDQMKSLAPKLQEAFIEALLQTLKEVMRQLRAIQEAFQNLFGNYGQDSSGGGHRNPGRSGHSGDDCHKPPTTNRPGDGDNRPPGPNRPGDGDNKPPSPNRPDRPANGTAVIDLDFDGGRDGDVNVTRSINNNNNDDDEDGGSSIRYVTLADGRKVVQFNIDRYSDRPAEEGKNYRSELTSFAPEDRLKPGHTYSTKWNMQLTEWERDRSPWGEMFLQVRQSNNSGVPDTALGVKDDKYSIFIHGKWTDLGLPPVSETIGDWQEWDLKIKMPEADGSGGQLEVWRNGKKVYGIPNYKLDSGYADGNPYLKFGIYKARWKIDNVPTDSVKRQANFDDFRLTDLGR